MIDSDLCLITLAGIALNRIGYAYDRATEADQRRPVL